MHRPSPTYKPLFIVGYPRSGTTWTMWLMAEHPQVVSSFHGGFFHALAPLVEWQKTPGGFGKFIITPNTAEFGETEFKEDRKTNWLDALPKSLLQEEMQVMARNFFDAIASQGNGPSVVAENTPENLSFMDWILDLIPEAHILHVIRDPRSTWLSIHRASKSWLKPNQAGAFPTTLEKNTLGWKSYIQMGRALQQRTPNYLEVRYEALKANGPTELARIYQWLDLPVDKGICERAFQTTDIKNMKKLMDSPSGFIGKGKTDDWRDSLSISDIRQIEYLAGQTMAELGYERKTKVLNKRPWQLDLSAFLSRASAAMRRRLSGW